MTIVLTSSSIAFGFTLNKNINMQKQAVVILGHGSKSLLAKEDFDYIVELVQQKMSTSVVLGAHMEMASPSLEEVVSQLSEDKVVQVVVLPYFLFNGNHILEDIPEKIQVLQLQYPNIHFKFGSPIGKEPLMAEIMHQKVKELI